MAIHHEGRVAIGTRELTGIARNASRRPASRIGTSGPVAQYVALVPALPNGPVLTIGRFDGALELASACDLRRLKFIDAYGLVGTACAIRAGLIAEPDLRVLPPSNKAIRAHLAVMGFADFLSGIGRSSAAPTHLAADATDVVVPLRRAKDSGGAQAMSHLLWEQLRGHVDPQVLEAMAEGVWEMLANALEHSGSDALIMGQVYSADRGGRAPDHDDRVQVVIGDTGQGILGSFRATGTQNAGNDIEAIRLALEYLVTSVPGDAGRGQGLFTTMEQVVGVRGRMVVRSGTGKVTIDVGGTIEEIVPPIPGVIVALSLPLYPG